MSSIGIGASEPTIWSLPLVFLAVNLGAATAPRAAPKWTIGTVCSRPGEACDTNYKRFAPYELPFRLPRLLKANAPVRSAPFYGVVLKRFSGQAASECDGGEWTISVERQRRRLQKLFPDQKVFASYQCPDMGAVSYTVNGTPDHTVFIAVYAGPTEREAQKVKLRAKIARQVPIQRMSVSFERTVQ